MDAPPTTKTEIAKWAVQSVVAAKATKIVKNQIIERTDWNEDGIVVDVTSGAAGMLIASRLRPYTDKAVDAVITRVQSWRESRKQEKTEEQ